MARITNYSKFFTDLANAVRTKLGISTPIKPNQILNLLKGESVEYTYTNFEDYMTDLANYFRSLYANGNYELISPDIYDYFIKGNQTYKGYVDNGLITLLDGETAPSSSNKRWASLIGNNYMVDYRNQNLIHDSANKCYVNNKTLYPYVNGVSSNFTGYHIETVGKINSVVNSSGSTGAWLVSMNAWQSGGIGLVENQGNLVFENNPNLRETIKYTDMYKKTFSCSIYWQTCTYQLNTAIVVKDHYYYRINNGNEYEHNVSNNKTEKRTNYNPNNMAIMVYYTSSNESQGSNAYRGDGAINCLRIYNRKLSALEQKYNYKIDKIRFNLSTL